MKRKTIGWIAGAASLAVAAATLPAAALDISIDISLGGLLGGGGGFGGTGPSSSQAPYLLGVAPGVRTESILTTGDAVNGYRMAGIPDGLGAFDNFDGTFTVVMNHELTNASGVVRAHGAKGAFVSKWIVDKSTLKVRRGEDLMKRLYRFNVATRAYEQLPAADATLALSRFCSADLPAQEAFFDVFSGRGTLRRIFMNGEESGSEGRQVAHVVTGPDAGSSYELPYLGRAGWENSVAKPGTGRKTVVAEMDDATTGQVYFYVGEKKYAGNDVERAGLTGGRLYGLKIDGIGPVLGSVLGNPEGDGTTLPGGSARFSLVDLGDVSGMTGAQLQAASVAAGVSTMNRPEDGSWDPSDSRNYYFNDTASFGGVTRTWKLRFDDPDDPLGGGTAAIAVAGTPAVAGPAEQDQPGPRMFDNMTVNHLGQVLSTEDVGNNHYLGGVYQYDPRRGGNTRVATADPARFGFGAIGTPGYLTKDEEASGIIPAPFLGAGMYLIDLQNHAPSADPELVEGGQLMAIRVPYSA